jgi:hypothetical protein
MQGIEILREKYAWPTSSPGIPFDDHGWFGWCHQAVLDATLSRDSKVIVELGSWLGKSTRFLLASAPRATVIAVDHWKGDQSILSGGEKEVADRLPRLYDSFLSNCWEYRDRLIPLRNTTCEGLLEIRRAGIEPDFIYLDAGHQYEEAKGDLEVIGNLFPLSPLAGDDYGGKWQGVKQAVDEYAKANGLEVLTIQHAWTAVRPEMKNGVGIKLVLSEDQRYKYMNDKAEQEKGK